MSPIDRAWRAAKNEWHLHALSVFSVAVAFVCLASALLIVVNIQSVQSRWQATGRASVYLKPNVKREQIADLEKALRATDGVTNLKYVSSEDARSQILGTAGNESLTALPSDAFPASIDLELTSDAATTRLAKMSDQLAALPAVEAVETYQAWSESLRKVLTGGLAAALVLALVVFGAVVSVVSSTMRLALQRRRREVEVLKLVGASNDYVTRPFLVEGGAQGALGAGAALMLLGVLYGIVKSHFDLSLGALLGVTPTFLPWTLSLFLIVLGALLGVSAAYVSLRRFLLA
jgi:cell division transport system permease protein